MIPTKARQKFQGGQTGHIYICEIKESKGASLSIQPLMSALHSLS